MKSDTLGIHTFNKINERFSPWKLFLIFNTNPPVLSLLKKKLKTWLNDARLRTKLFTVRADYPDWSVKVGYFISSHYLLLA